MPKWFKFGIVAEIAEAIGNVGSGWSEQKHRTNHFEESYQRRMKDPIHLELPTRKASDASWQVIQGEYTVLDEVEERDDHEKVITW